MSPSQVPAQLFAHGSPQPSEKEIRKDLSEAYEVAVVAERLIEKEVEVPEFPEPYWR